MKMNTATVADVEKALEEFKAAAGKDSALEGLYGKKLAIAADALTPKDGVIKDLNQAYTNAEKKWAKNVLNDEADGCKKDNKLEKIKHYVMKSDAYSRLISDEKTKAKVENWFEKNLPPEVGSES